MAAPAVTGTIALMFEAAGRRLSIEETHRSLLASCERPAAGADVRRMGSGYLRPADAVASVRPNNSDDVVSLVGASGEEVATMLEAVAATATQVPGCGEPVPTAARPAVLKRDSRHSAVGDAQARLNQVHTNEVMAGGPGLPNAPLVVDCVFGPKTYGAVVGYQRLTFPNQPNEHDGRIGPKTWAKLDARDTPAPAPPVFPPVPPPPPIPPKRDDNKCAPSRLRVAVVGGGFAGLAAAWSLATNGTQVTVFEATGAVGGRVRTRRTPR